MRINCFTERESRTKPGRGAVCKAEGREQESSTITGQGWRQGGADHRDYKGEIGDDSKQMNPASWIYLARMCLLSFLSPYSGLEKGTHCLWDMLFLQVNLEKRFEEYTCFKI